LADEPVPSLGRILATDGNAGFLFGSGFLLSAAVALIVAFNLSSRQETVSLGWGAAAIVAPLVLLLPPACLWARAIQQVFRQGKRLEGTVSRQYRTVRGMLIVEFRFLDGGKEHHHKNYLIPQDRTSALKPSTTVTVVVAKPRFPGPLIKEAYS
jgi:hypothetical protein